MEIAVDLLPPFVQAPYRSAMAARQWARDHVFDHLGTRHLTHAARGSWLHGDFHLDVRNGSTMSDLDLLIPKVSAESKERIRAELEEAYRDSMDLRVSVHPSDFLGRMTLGDSRVLNVAECMTSLRLQPGKHQRDYVLAKICLLLIRNNLNEQYQEVALRVSTEAVWRIFSVKMGVENTLEDRFLKQALEPLRNDLIDWFLQCCVERSPSPASILEIEERLSRCRSIEPWLLRHMQRKLGLE